MGLRGLSKHQPKEQKNIGKRNKLVITQLYVMFSMGIKWRKEEVLRTHRAQLEIPHKLNSDQRDFLENTNLLDKQVDKYHISTRMQPVAMA
jgi:hypothetical protein